MFGVFLQRKATSIQKCLKKSTLSIIIDYLRGTSQLVRDGIHAGASYLDDISLFLRSFGRGSSFTAFSLDGPLSSLIVAQIVLMQAC